MYSFPHNSKMWTDAMGEMAKLYPKLREEERAAILLKGAAMSSLERDSGFNSGSSEHEEDLWSRDGLITPENACSEDSVPEPKLPAAGPPSTAGAVSLVKNKRKSSEPLRVVAETELMAPLKKRIRFDEERKQLELEREREQERERVDAGSPRPSSRATTTSPFRPWAPPPGSLEPPLGSSPGGPPVFPNPADLLVRHPAVTTLHRAVNLKPLEQLQPLALVAKKSSSSGGEQASPVRSGARSSSSLSSPQHSPEWPHHHHHLHHQQQQLNHHHLNLHQLHHHQGPPTFAQPHAAPSLDGTNDSVTDLDRSMAMTPLGDGKGISSSSSGSQTRNYKNMTRERRIEANARERTRVHTISAAYDKLRKAVPAYSNAQKLSKLSILRIAGSYILTLSRLAGKDYSEGGSEPSIADCVEMVTKTIQTEGKIRKKKDE